MHNKGLEFKDCDNLVFVNCQFEVNIRNSRENAFGLRLSGGSARLQNPVFDISVEDTPLFVVVAADRGANYLIVQTPLIKVNYHRVYKLETYVFKGSERNTKIPYFEAFSSSIHYNTRPFVEYRYDGHCCLKQSQGHDRPRCKHRHCSSCQGTDVPQSTGQVKNDKCDKLHACCYKRCSTNRPKITTIRLFRGMDQVSATINAVKLIANEGKGIFNIAAGNSCIFINGLTAITNLPDNWEVGHYRNIFISAFVSNYKSACKIKEFNCIKEVDSEKGESENSEEFAEMPENYLPASLNNSLSGPTSKRDINVPPEIMWNLVQLIQAL